MQVRKEGTRNFAMAAAEPAYWNLVRFEVCKLLGRPRVELTKRQMIRLFNLEIFHRLFFAGGTPAGEFLSDIMTARGLAFCASDRDAANVAWTNPAQLGGG